MLKPSWENTLSQTLSDLRSPDSLLKIAVVGIGQELRGDDAAGVEVARRLLRGAGQGANGGRPVVAHVPLSSIELLVIDAGAAPENCTGPLRRFGPDLVLLVDAAQMDETPGSVRWLDWQETSGMSASTHTLPPYVLASYLTAELGCALALIGMQPADTSFDASLSPPVRRAVEDVVQVLLSVCV